MRRNAGVTLVELLVVLVILSILAAAAVPYAEVSVRRDKELELRRALREVRTAIDAFHADWEAGRMSGFSSAASEDGYPRRLEILVEGVDLAGASGKQRRYLRRVPRDPFADQTVSASAQWVLRSYRDAPDSGTWGGEDVYDIRSASAGTALDGSRYREW